MNHLFHHLNFILVAQGWVGNKDHTLHAGEGQIHTARWSGNFIAWANDVSVKVGAIGVSTSISLTRKNSADKLYISNLECKLSVQYGCSQIPSCFGRIFMLVTFKRMSFTSWLDWCVSVVAPTSAIYIHFYDLITPFPCLASICMFVPNHLIQTLHLLSGL